MLWADAHIFVYHRFDDTRFLSADTTTEQLTQQFEHFRKNNYEVVPLEKMIDKLSKNEDIPSNWVALTIDDAYKSFYENGLKTFKKYNYPFTLFVYVKATDKKYSDYMTWEQLKETKQYGDVQLHSYDHPKLQKLSTDEIIEDTKKAFEVFEEKMGYAPTMYAYPYGEYTKRVKNTLKNNFPFKAILNQNTGAVTSKSDIFDIDRIALVGEANISHKLRYKSFNVKWQEPKEYPKDGILKRVKAKVDKKHKKLKLYITSNGWRDVKVVDGIVDEKLDIPLKRDRVRIILGRDVFTISNHLINKN
jgi:peptidoglycan/xylan/chitin deacetylase (PgdA/CDA1 family)